eukprot:scaffold68685_cov18-Tisochrysis_lutea.AAC.1
MPVLQESSVIPQRTRIPVGFLFVIAQHKAWVMARKHSIAVMMPCLCLVLELDLRQPLFVQMLKVAYLLVVFSPDFKPRSLRKISLPRCLQEIYQSNEDNISMPGQGCVAQFLQEKIDPDKAPSQQDTPKAQSIILLDHMICAAKRHRCFCVEDASNPCTKENEVCLRLISTDAMHFGLRSLESVDLQILT